MGQNRHDSIDGEAFSSQSITFSDKLLSHVPSCGAKHPDLFVQHHLSQSERKWWWKITRDLPQLHKLHEIMEQVYALFDRRCRTQTALDKLDKLRRSFLRFPPLGETLKKLYAPTLEKALTFLDDKLLPSTSNAVERGNRRYRKMQKQVYRVRTQAQICARLALDMWREAQGEGRQQTLASLHQGMGWINPVSLLQSLFLCAPCTIVARFQHVSHDRHRWRGATRFIVCLSACVVMRRAEPQGSAHDGSDDRGGPVRPLCITAQCFNAPVLRCRGAFAPSEAAWVADAMIEADV